MRILITGLNSYIAKNLKIWIIKNNPDFFVDLVSVRDNLPTVKKLSEYDVLIHLAAIVHQKKSNKSEDTYYKVNTELTEELAIISKKSNIKQFIFFSTMAVYGVKDKIKEKAVINKNTICKPVSAYGKSKLLAEQKILNLESEHFKIVIIRPPMVYGDNCTGNYAKLYKLAKITPIFPLVNNERSMININTLSELVRLIIINKSNGIFTPQDSDYKNTSQLVLKIGESFGKKIYLSKLLGFLICKININFVSKIFGNLIYDKEISNHFEEKYFIE